MLDSQGWKKGSDGIRAKDGQKMSVEIVTSATAKEFNSDAVLMQEAWKNIGLDVTVKAITYTQEIQLANFTHAYDVIVFNTNPGLDPDLSNYWTTRGYGTGGLNASKYSNPQVDQLFDEATTASDKAKRKATYAKISNILATDLPAVPIIYPNIKFYFNKRVHGLTDRTGSAPTRCSGPGRSPRTSLSRAPDTGVATVEPEILAVVAMPETAPATLGERLRRVEDRDAIAGVLASYCHLEDAHRWEDLVDLFTDDVERRLAGTLHESLRGRDALLHSYVKPTMKRGASGSGEPASGDQLVGISIRHLMTTVLVRFGPSGDSAFAIAYYQLVATRGAGESFRRGAHEGTYLFELVRQPGRWRIRRQVIWTDNSTNPMFRADGQL